MTLNNFELYETSKKLYLNDPYNEEYISNLTNLQNKMNELKNLKEVIQTNYPFNNNILLIDYLEYYYNIKYDDIINVYYYDADMNRIYNFSYNDIAKSFVDSFRIKFNKYDYVILNFTYNNNNILQLCYRTILL